MPPRGNKLNKNFIGRKRNSSPEKLNKTENKTQSNNEKSQISLT